MNKQEFRIGIIRLSALGDIINSAIVLQIIKKHYPHAKIEWITQSGFVGILQNHPDIHKVHGIDIPGLKKSKKLKDFISIKRQLNALGKFDKLIDMQGLLKSAIVGRMIGRNIHGFSSSSSKEGISAYLYKSSSNIPYEENIIVRNVKVVCNALTRHYSENYIKNKSPIFPYEKSCALIKKDQKNVVFVLGASWPSKVYPKESFKEVARALGSNVILIWGNDEEKELASWIAQRAENAKVAPKLSLSELITLISNADLVIGNDTGPTHMAWAQNIPSITLFGPTNERMMYETDLNIALHSPSKVDVKKINKQDFSIAQIDIHKVTRTAQELLK